MIGKRCTGSLGESRDGGCQAVQTLRCCYSQNLPVAEYPHSALRIWEKTTCRKTGEEPPLPPGGELKKVGVQTDTGTSNRGREKAVPLGFLPEEERQVVLNVAAQILLPQENDRMRPEIVAHRKKIAEWSKRKRQQEREFGAGWNRGRNREPAPLFAEGISEEQRPRVFQDNDALAKAMTPLGWELTADLKFSREQDFVTLLFSESTIKFCMFQQKKKI